MDKEITKEQFEAFNDELKEFGFRCTLDENESGLRYITIYRGGLFVANVNSLTITFFDWKTDITLTEKCHILELATKYFVE